MAIIKCEHCLTGFKYIVRTEGFPKKRIVTEDPICSYCGKKNSKERRIKCLKCGEPIMYSILEGTNNLHCEKCEEPLPAMTTIHLECPKCSEEADVDIHAENYSCLNCEQSLDVRYEVNRIENTAGNRNSVVVRNSSPAGGNYVIWKDKRHSFPYASRLIVSQANEYALIEKNGILACYKHEDPDFENGFLLGDSLKSRDILLKEAAENGENPILWINIYWVSRESIPVEWREVIDLFMQDGRVEGRIRPKNNDRNESKVPRDAFATVFPAVDFKFVIFDAKAFYEKIQADTLTKDQLVCLASPNNMHAKTLQRLVMEAIRKCLNKRFDPNLNLGFEMDAFTEATKAEINTSLEPWGLRIDSFSLDVELSWHSETSSELKIPNVLEENNATVDLSKKIERIHDAVQALNETVQNNHQEQMDGIHAMETGIASQVTVLQDAIEGKLDDAIAEIRNELSSIENEARNLGIASAEISDQLAAFQRVENAGLEELRDLDGKIDNLRKAFLNYKKESTEQEKASIDLLIEKLDNQQNAVIGRIDALEKELSQRADAFSSTLDKIFNTGKATLEQIITAAAENRIIAPEEAVGLNSILERGTITLKQCQYMDFDNVEDFQRFVNDENLEKVIRMALIFARDGKFEDDNSTDLDNYTPYTFFIGYCFEKLVKAYYHKNVYMPYINKYEPRTVDTYKNEAFKANKEEWNPQLSDYASGYNKDWTGERGINPWNYPWKGKNRYHTTIDVANRFNSMFKLEKNLTAEWWAELHVDMRIVIKARNDSTHTQTPISKQTAQIFYKTMFKGENSLLRRLIMMRDVTLKEPEVTVSAE